MPINIINPNITKLTNNYFYFDINDQNVIEVIFAQNSAITNVYKFSIVFGNFEKESLYLSPSGTHVKFGHNIPTLVITPLYFDVALASSNATNTTFITRYFYDNGENALEYLFTAFYAFELEPHTILFKLTTSPMVEYEPYLVVDLSVYNDIFDQVNHTTYRIASRNASSIKCEINGKVFYGKKHFLPLL